MDNLFTYKLSIAYDGTHYSGWQVQPNGLSIQEVIEKKLTLILQSPIKIVGSGRTDAGVHALGQTAHFKYFHDIDPYKILGSLNSLLPPDIRILNLQSVPNEFHAQHSAVGKEYHYHLFLHPVMDPFKRLYTWHVRTRFDTESLKQGAQAFLGLHDFRSFTNEAYRGVAKHDPVRHLKRLDVIEEEGGVRLEFEADGFLYKMVRNIVGTLVEVGLGKRDASCVSNLLAAKDRRVAGMAAPPQGLFLFKVNY